MFKAAWHGGIPHLPVFGDGQNFLPTIHILDLARYNHNNAYIVEEGSVYSFRLVIDSILDISCHVQVKPAAQCWVRGHHI